MFPSSSHGLPEKKYDICCNELWLMGEDDDIYINKHQFGSLSMIIRKLINI